MYFNPYLTEQMGPQRELRGKPFAVAKPNMQSTIPIKHTNAIPTNIDHIPSNTTHRHSSTMYCVCEDNEAAIKIIIKCFTVSA